MLHVYRYNTHFTLYFYPAWHIVPYPLSTVNNQGTVSMVDPGYIHHNSSKSVNVTMAAVVILYRWDDAELVLPGFFSARRD